MKLRTAKEAWLFYCKGCEEYHQIPRDGRWSFNGDFDSPTFTPSVVTGISLGKICHLFVTEGQIHYLGDCHHKMANLTIAMENEE